MKQFIYSENATKFCEIFLVLLTTVNTVKSKGKISQNFVVFLEYINFIDLFLTGRYTCSASNQIGTSEATAEVIVSSKYSLRFSSYRI